MIEPAEVIIEARRWLGVPFRHQGRTRYGVDCVGLVICVAAKLGIIPIDLDRRDYGRTPSRDELANKVREYCEPADDLQPGCIAAIRWNKELAHMAIFTGTTLIHSYENVGGVVEHGYRRRWVRLVDSAWLLPGVNYGQ